MRDVTDNVTGELAGLEQKRGRGRPSTGHAKSNAERQAAYRARRQAERATDRSVAVTKKPADVDAYDDCRIEVERLQELLAESRAATERATRTLQSVMHQNSWVAAGERADQEELEEVRRELEAKQGQVGMLIDYQQELDGQLRATRLQVELAEAERNKAFDENRHLKEQIADAKKSVTQSNGNFVPAQEYQRLQLDVASLRRDNEYLEGEVTRLSGVNSALRAADKKSVTRKAVTKTSSNENPVSFDVMLDLISLAAKANTFEQRQKVRETVLWADTFVRTQLVSEVQMRAAGEAIYGERKVVTCKA
ncbi:hypothetical protein RSP673_013410 [Ralstonia solanacearum P673]|uniref:hypothetical protein n=1 Tax=Ralstonia solanacearum TaxID=305 RepID=UPI002029D9E1|nr:hypothetical protein [Ralstonia solanacearum]MCL9850287.1 hypothetical protein [Ralstonia solanacearum]MCL9857441.1 hypothetical protein [Ralstonia solanacearum]MCL9864899.1 hypothetical protein [Ralstonia solanacearum]MCL9869291.1 hypothetical protein [Ralstonia solanacearum]MCL9874155.1 hypothetical protein [Ralstonia solanacearum]